MPTAFPSAPLYRCHELAYRTQYAELKERVRAAGNLLPGTPGTLYQRNGTGHAYWYRVYYEAPGVQAEQRVGAAENDAALVAVRDRIEFSRWTAKQVSDLRKLEFQVADKSTARVLVELHNSGTFDAGLTVVGTLGYMAWLNELGARAVAARTQDIDLARRQQLRLATHTSFLSTMQATRLPFVAVPGLPSEQPATSMKLPGRDGLRIDLLAPARSLGAIVRVPELGWHAQGVPHYDYLLDDTVPAAVLAGGHCVPVRLPRTERFVWHKLYSSAARRGAPEKAAKDLLQAATLAAVLVEQGDEPMADSWTDVPAGMQTTLAKSWPALRRALAAHPQTLEQFELAMP